MTPDDAGQLRINLLWAAGHPAHCLATLAPDDHGAAGAQPPNAERSQRAGKAPTS